MRYIFLSLLLLMVTALRSQETDIIRTVNRSLLQNKLQYVPPISRAIADTGGREVIRSTHSFYISEFEVSNQEYRQFVNYVLDSIARTLLSHFLPDGKTINWKIPIAWDDKKLESLWVQENWSRSTINTELVIYDAGNLPVNVYPDTLVWLRDFGYSYNEPLVKSYFRHQKYDHFPVVGVNYWQAVAFCHWKSRQLNDRISSSGKKDLRVEVMLPTAAQWEAAAYTNKKTFMQLLFREGSYNINSGQVVDSDGFLVKDYADDGFYYTSPVHQYRPNDLGLYNMMGNVSEWVIRGSSNVYSVHDSLFIAKGGGWDSPPSKLMPSFNRPLQPSAAHSFVGFRYIVRITSRQ